MSLKAGLMARGVTVALLGVALLAVPAGATGPSEGAQRAETTRLVLHPVCTGEDLHRFAVVNEAGPATRFTVEVDGASAEPVDIAAGETVRFRVAAGQEAVGITWPDGRASATPAGQACAADAVPASEEAGPAQPVDPAPQAPERAGQERPEEPAAPPSTAAPSPRQSGAAQDVPPATPGDSASAPAVRGGRSLARRAHPPVAGADDPARGADADPAPEAAAAARQGPAATAPACPDGWVAVDSDGDGTVDGRDACELVVETGAQAASPGTLLPTAALIVTVGLLIASVALGAAGRRGTGQRSE